MSRELPELHPGHRHQWEDFNPHRTGLYTSLARCTVCGFEVPRNLAKLDGTTASQVPVTDNGVCT